MKLILCILFVFTIFARNGNCGSSPSRFAKWRNFGNGHQNLRNFNNRLRGFYGQNSLREESDDDDVPCRTVPDLPPPDQDTDRLSLWELMDKSKEKLLLSPDHRDVVLLLGNTGSGKTTITQLVAGNASALEVVQTEAGDVIIIDPAEKIGRTQASQTLIPELVVDPGTNLAIYDCPGFSDNRGPTVDITVNFLLKRVTDYIQSVKLIFTVIFSSVDGFNDKTDFDRLVTSAVRMITNFDKMKDGIGLVVTKVPLYDARGRKLKESEILKKVHSHLQGYKDAQEKQFNNLRPDQERTIIEKKIAFVEILLQDNRIAIMVVPKDCGIMTESKETLKTKDKLSTFLKNTINSVPSTETDFGYALTDSSFLQINDWVKEISKNVTATFQKLAVEIEKGLRIKLSKNKDFPEYKSILENELSQLNQTLVRLEPNDSANLEKISLEVESFLNASGYSQLAGELRNDLKRLGDYLTFFVDMKPDESPNKSGWLVPLRDYMVDRLGKLQYWSGYLATVREQLGSFDFQKQKGSAQAPSNPDPDFVENLWKATVDLRAKEVFKSQVLNADDKAYLNLILNEALTPTKITCSGSSLSVEGTYVKTSEFTDSNGRYKNCPSADVTMVFASRKVFIDSNITPYKKGVQELAILSPVWEITSSGQTRICLDGREASGRSSSKASSGKPGTGDGGSGSQGTAGTPGLPGGSAGNFYGLGQTFINARNLFITANGGPGGWGQGGGDGGDGHPGGRITFSDFPDCKTQFQFMGEKYFDKIDTYKTEPVTFMGNPTQLTRTYSWVMKYGGVGGGGGSGANGGVGGLGGWAGHIEISNLGSQAGADLPHTEASIGPRGQPGAGGSGGRGGRRGLGAKANMVGIVFGDCSYSSQGDYQVDEQGPNGSSGGEGLNWVGLKAPDTQRFSLNGASCTQAFKEFLNRTGNPGLMNHFANILK